MSAEFNASLQDNVLGVEAFARVLAPFDLEAGARIAVAVSGGADSMALVRLLAAWSGERGIDLKAVTVDHRLRAEAAAEAAQVGAWLAPLGIAHTTLTWEEGALQSKDRSQQKAARDARYGLMAAWCAAEGRSHLFLAHHADDQVETFLIRLTRGSGVSGLAAMMPATALGTASGSVILARPLLGFAKADLAAVCRQLGQPWLEDPSNGNTASTRVRFRQAARLLEEEGFTRARLLETVGHMQRARAALDQAAAQLLRTATAWDQYGAVRLSLGAWTSAPEEIALRALSRLLTAAGGQIYGPRFESLTRLAQQMRHGPWRDATLHGCIIAREGAGESSCILIHREPAQIDHAPPLSAGQTVVWDGRFRIRMPANMPGGPFRIAGWKPEESFAGPSDAPPRLRASLPAVYDSFGMAALPHTGALRADLAVSGVEPPDVVCIPALNTLSQAGLGVPPADDPA